MIAVITGDLVASQKMPDKAKWVERLRTIMEAHAEDPSHSFAKVKAKEVGVNSGLGKARWEIYRGDGFQIELETPEVAFHLVLLIRSGLKAMPEFYENGLDVRMAVGIGESGFVGSKVGESDGEAYRYSGPLLDKLKDEKSKLQMNSPWEDLNERMNVCFALASALMDDWSQPSAEIVWMRLSKFQTQERMAKSLNISQPAVHKRYISSHNKELIQLDGYFGLEVAALIGKQSQ